MPPKHKLQAQKVQPPLLRDEGALRVLEEELHAWLATCSGPDVLCDPAGRDHLRAYVSRLKEMDYSPEAMVIQLKQLFLVLRRRCGDADSRTLGALREAVVRICIEEYFGYRRS